MGDQPFSTFDPTKPRKAINAWSQKRLDRVKDRSAVIAETRQRAGGRCEAEALLPRIRCKPPFDCHEIATRARTGGTSAYDATVTAYLCRAHHEHLGTHPAEAEELGLMAPSAPSSKTRLLYDRHAEG